MIESLLPTVLVLSLGTANVQAEPTVNIHIQVIEASTSSKKFDPALVKLKKAFRGYQGARLVDQLEAKVKKGASVSLQILRKSRLLRVTFKERNPDGSVKLNVAIDALKFSADTTHKNKNATVVVSHETSATTAVFLAVTPKLK